MKIGYGALLKPEKDSEAVNVVFPDLMGVVTCGEDEKDAIAMAKDALFTAVDMGFCEGSNPTSLEKLKSMFPQYKVIWVEIEK